MPARSDTLWRVCLGLAAVTVFLLLVASAYLGPRLGGTDEVSLSNPVYMKLLTGKLTYPSHGFFDGMYIHPPVHVSVVAWLRSFGLQHFFAEALPALALLTLCIVLTLAGPFERAVKAGLLAGLFAPIGIIRLHEWTHGWWGMRPDWHAFSAWMAGLLLLEWGRLAGWDWRWLLAGSFLLTYASGIHYWAGPAFLGAGVYMIWAFRTLDRGRAWRANAALAAGGLVFGLPYLFLFFLPRLHGIRVAYAMNEGFHSIGYATSLKVQLYARILQEGAPGNSWLIWALARGVPAILISTLALWRFPTARGILLASLPLQVFVYAAVTHVQSYYLAPEVAMLAVGLSATLVSLGGRVGSVLCLAPVAYLAIVSGQWRAWFPPVVPRYHEMEIARAVGKNLLGPDARVGYRMSLWYTAGEARSYMVDHDLHMPPEALVSVPVYFRLLDAVATNVHFANPVSTRVETAEGTLYSKGLVDLKGFYWAQDDQDYGYLLFGAGKPERLRGFVRRDEQLLEFQEDPGGTFRFRTALCPAGKARHGAAVKYSYLLGIPRPGSKESTEFLVATISPAAEEPPAEGCRLIQETPGLLVPADTDQMVAHLRATDKPIRFFRSIDTLAAPDRTSIAKTVYATPGPNSQPLEPGFQLDRAYAASSGAKVRMGPPLWSRMPPGMGQYGAAIPLAAPPRSKCWLEVRFRARTGILVLALRQKGKDSFLFQSMELMPSEEVRDLYLNASECSGAEELVLRGYDTVEPTEVELYNLRLWVGKGE